MSFSMRPFPALAAATALAVTTLFAAPAAQAIPSYLRSTVNAPWGEQTNEMSMDTVFGGGGWNDFRYETVNTAALFASPDFIFMEGGDDNADEMEAFINANAAAIASFVTNGGVIFFNAAPNEGDGMTFGFGVDLVYQPGPYCDQDCTAIDPLHPIFNGPFGSTGTSFSGTSFSHASVTGPLTGLIQDVNGNIVLGEQAVGAGLALFGGMTTTNFHSPDPEVTNLRNNILAYGAANVAAAVPAPAGIVLLGVAALVAGAARRRLAA